VSPLSDEEQRFVDALRARDPRAFRLLVRHYQDRVHGLLFRMLRHPEEAREVAQDVFVAVFQKIDGYRGESALSTWIFRIAVNHAKNRMKYAARRHAGRQDSFEAMASPPAVNPLAVAIPRPDEAHAQGQLTAALEAALSALDEEPRLMVLLRDIEGQSYEDIATITGLPLGTVKSRIHRARLRLRELLGPALGLPRREPSPREP
jgi:RNA polymerase sigma-70 factor (ECF subfamily)